MEDKLHLELVKFEEELSKLKSAVDYIEAAKKTTEAATTIINNVVNLKVEFENFSKQTKLLIAKIDKVDFPSRLDRLDSTVVAINANISNLQTRIESIERNIKDEIKSTRKSLISEMTTKFSSISSELSKQNRELIKNRYILIAGVVLIVLGLVYIIIK